MDNQISEAYAMGIKEGRSLFNAMNAVTKQDAKRLRDNAAELQRSSSGSMKQMYKGERDFWNNKLKKL